LRAARNRQERGNCQKNRNHQPRGCRHITWSSFAGLDSTLKRADRDTIAIARGM
jgi:hypothetical protein